MKLGRVILFVQFAALWKICPSFHPVPKLLEKKKKKGHAWSEETCWSLVASFSESACTEHVPALVCITRLHMYSDRGERELVRVWDRRV